jgi:hypothetical protein
MLRFLSGTALLGAAYMLGRLTPPSEVLYAHQTAELARIERQTAIADALAPFDVVTSALLRFVPLVAIGVLLAWVLGVLAIDLVNRMAAARD